MNKKIEDRLIEKRFIHPETNCWLWEGSRLSNGYGNIKYEGKTELVHRLSLIIFKGIIFELNEQANHIKECPYKHCFNPDHLYKGNQDNNMKDRWDIKGRKTKLQKNKEYYSRYNQHRKNFGRI